ncbi:hypothetical protein OEZ86_004290 [Tetradesmus obliquus]|nr:hypothetical protein OEZ86_004290 [Tetradesmus obliquus]
MNFISRTEQLRRYAAENQKQTRKRLVQPVPPDPFSRTKPRRHRQDSDTLDVDLEELLGVEVLGDGGMINAAAAAAVSAAQPAGQDPVPSITAKDLQWAWVEYSRATEYKHDPHALVRAELAGLGPAALCPACAGTPGPADAACLAADTLVPGHSAAHLFAAGTAAAAAAVCGLSAQTVLAAGLLPAPADEFIPLWSPWRGHGARCCLRYSGLYLPGACRRVGEMCEQLWAQLKPLASVTRYMAMPNYLDCIDDALGFVASSRMAGFVPFMVQQHKSNLRKLEECRNHYKDLVKLARKQGFTELQLMHAAVDACSCSSTPAARAALDDDAARLKAAGGLRAR